MSALQAFFDWQAFRLQRLMPNRLLRPLAEARTVQRVRCQPEPQRRPSAPKPVPPTPPAGCAFAIDVASQLGHQLGPWKARTARWWEAECACGRWVLVDAQTHDFGGSALSVPHTRVRRRGRAPLCVAGCGRQPAPHARTCEACTADRHRWAQRRVYLRIAQRKKAV